MAIEQQEPGQREEGVERKKEKAAPHSPYSLSTFGPSKRGFLLTAAAMMSLPSSNPIGFCPNAMCEILSITVPLPLRMLVGC